jgi:hypothetical protein
MCKLNLLHLVRPVGVFALDFALCKIYILTSRRGVILNSVMHCLYMIVNKQHGYVEYGTYFPTEDIWIEMKFGVCTVYLSSQLSVHCNFVRDCKYSERGWGCTPHPPSLG